MGQAATGPKLEDNETGNLKMDFNSAAGLARHHNAGGKK